MTTAAAVCNPAIHDPESQLVTDLIRAFTSAGSAVRTERIVDLYVLLKARPLVLLVGPPRTGKARAIELFAKVLIGQTATRCQMMTGHAWFASRCRNIGLVTEAQAHLNDEKILALLEEASLPENAARLFLACLRRISRAELAGLFSMLAFQLRRQEIIRLPMIHLEAPLPFPANLILVATLDADLPFQIDADLTASIGLARWDENASTPALPYGSPTSALSERIFLSARIQTVEAARRKLHCLGLTEDIAACLDVQETLLSESDLERTYIYLANSWSDRGTGLFHPNTEHNLATSVRFAMSQVGAKPLASEAD